MADLVLWSPNSSVGNFPLLEQPPSRHQYPGAFLKCLTAQGSVSSVLTSPQTPSMPYEQTEEHGRAIFFFNSKPTGEWEVHICITDPSRVRVF